VGVSIKPKRKSTAGFASGSSIRILGLEATQVIQNLANQVPLIKGKPTVVRVYVNPIGFSKTTNIQGEIAVAPSPGAPVKYIGSSNTIRVSGAAYPDLGSQRRKLDSSLNFVLPAEILQWNGISVQVNRIFTASGDVTTTNGPTVTLGFDDAPVLRVKAIGLRYVWTKSDGTTSNVSPEAFQFDYLRSFLLRAYPVSAIEWSQLVVQANPLFAPPFSGPLTPDGEDPLWLSKLDLAHNQLSAIRAKDIDSGTDPRTHYYGLVSDASAGLFFRGAAKDVPQAPDPTIVAVGPAGNPQQYGGLKWDRNRTFGDWYGAHELAHTFGRFHPGFCDQDASDPGFPYSDGRIGDDANGDMIGLDVGNPELDLERSAMDNQTCHDIMTYCDYQWMSAYSYQAILARLKEEDARFAPPSV
jgi:hypothetical protein